MPGSLIDISPEQMGLGWASLQQSTRQAWQRFSDASDIHELAASFTALSEHRLVSFAQPMLLRGQHVERMTAGALLGHPTFARIADKDVDVYRIWRLVPLTPPATSVLSAVLADLDLLQLKCAELGYDLRRQLGKPGGEIPRRTALFFGLELDALPAPRLKRRKLKKDDLDTLAQAQFGHPVNSGRHFFGNELHLAGTDPRAVFAGKGHAHIGAEPFSDSMALAPRAVYTELIEGLAKAIGVLGVNSVAGPFSLNPSSRLAPAHAPSVKADPYLQAKGQHDGRILPPPVDAHTLVALNAVSRAWSMLTSKAHIRELGNGEATLCAVALDGIHPFDLEDARAQPVRALQTLGQAICLVLARRGTSGEICVPLNPRTALAVYKSGQQAIGTGDQFKAAGSWVQRNFPEVVWPDDAGEAFLAFCSLCARWHRHHIEPSTLAAASRAMPSAAANRESMLRLAGVRPKGATHGDDAFVPLRSGPARKRLRTRAALGEIRKMLSKYGDRRARIGEEQQRARDLKAELASIAAHGDFPARGAKEIFSIECDRWLEQHHRASKAGRQFSSLETYGTEVIAGLQLVPTWDNQADWSAPDFCEWFADVKALLTKPSESPPELFGISRFLLIGRDHLGWDVPDVLLRGQSFVAKDGLRKAAAATLTFSFDYSTARSIVDQRLQSWPLILNTAQLAMDFRENVASRAGERCTLPANCLTSRSNRLVFQNHGYSDIKSPNGIRLCQTDDSLAAKIRARSQTPDIKGGARSHLFLDESGEDWTSIDIAEKVITDAMVIASQDPSYRSHASRGFVACNLCWPGWEAPSQGLLDGNPVSAAVSWQPLADANRIVKAAFSMGVGHASTLLVYYSANWPLLRAIAVNRLLAEHEPDPSFVTEALGDTQAVRAARARAANKGEHFSAWDVIGRIAVARAALPHLERRQPRPVMASLSAGQTSAPTLQAIARYMLARKTGTPRKEAAGLHAIPIEHAIELDERMEDN